MPCRCSVQCKGCGRSASRASHAPWARSGPAIVPGGPDSASRGGAGSGSGAGSVVVSAWGRSGGGRACEGALDLEGNASSRLPAQLPRPALRVGPLAARPRVRGERRRRLRSRPVVIPRRVPGAGLMGTVLSPLARALLPRACVCFDSGGKRRWMATPSPDPASPRSRLAGAPRAARRSTTGPRMRQPVLAGYFDAQALEGGPAGVEEPSGGRHLEGALAIAQAVMISILKARVARIRLDPVRPCSQSHGDIRHRSYHPHGWTRHHGAKLHHGRGLGGGFGVMKIWEDCVGCPHRSCGSPVRFGSLHSAGRALPHTVHDLVPLHPLPLSSRRLVPLHSGFDRSGWRRCGHGGA